MQNERDQRIFSSMQTILQRTFIPFLKAELWRSEKR